MVRTAYVCEACGLAYSEKKLAEDCQKWCTDNKSCNLNLIRKSIGKFEPHVNPKPPELCDGSNAGTIASNCLLGLPFGSSGYIDLRIW
ncbi:hypothetical protein HZC09_00615 [Candidatus Micrarchaeota archaeon]|nr:hypothetical protein [Candidatus Micrarchaeota archaeon]